MRVHDHVPLRGEKRIIKISEKLGAPGVGDIDLVARVVAQQDADAFGELVRRHQSQVRNFLRKLTRDPSLADDLAQDAFLHAWNKLHTFRGKGSFIGWLLKVAYTTFLQSKRKSKLLCPPNRPLLLLVQRLLEP